MTGKEGQGTLVILAAEQSRGLAPGEGRRSWGARGHQGVRCWGRQGQAGDGTT